MLACPSDHRSRWALVRTLRVLAAREANINVLDGVLDLANPEVYKCNVSTDETGLDGKP